MNVATVEELVDVNYKPWVVLFTCSSVSDLYSSGDLSVELRIEQIPSTTISFTLEGKGFRLMWLFLAVYSITALVYAF